MGLYAHRPVRLLGQLTADLFMIIWVVLWWLAGRLIERSVLAIAAPARQSAGAGRRLSVQVREAADQAGQVPRVGEQLRRPFDAAVAEVDQLVSSAEAQVASIERFAGVAGWVVFLMPVAMLLVIWLPARLRYYLRARAAQRFIDAAPDLDLFALRAMVTQPMHVLATISDDPVGAWRAGDRRVIAELAERELRRSGLRAPARLAAPDG